MALTKEEISKFRNILDNCKKPLFFFDADPDGLTSFLLLYRIKKEGSGVFVKKSDNFQERMRRKVEEYSPDAIFILDIPVLDSFFDNLKITTCWLDHHPPLKIRNNHLNYFNPRVHNDSDNRPTSYWAYKIANNTEDSWIACLGNVADWFIPDYKDEVLKKHPDYFNKKAKTAPEILFSTDKLGMLYRIISLMFKTSTKDINSCIKILTRIKHYDEILEQTTSQGKFIFKKASKITSVYENYRKEAFDQVTEDNFCLIKLHKSKYSFSSELSNEIVFKNPDKLVVVCTEAEENYRCSLRSEKHMVINILNETLKEVPTAAGGGHDHACGAHVSTEQFNDFITSLRKNFQK